MTGKNVLVLGAASSIGLNLISKLKLNGCNIHAVLHKNIPKSFLNEDIKISKIDLENSKSIDNFKKDIDTSYDIVFFLSSILPGKSLDEYDDKLIKKVMGINFIGQVIFLKNLLPHLSKNSQIIIMSSISADKGSFDPIYAASKSAFYGLIKSLVYISPNIRINLISPGLIENTSMFHNMKKSTQQKHISNSPTKRLTTIEEIVEIMLNICDPAWSNMTGQIIRVNGGLYV